MLTVLQSPYIKTELAQLRDVQTTVRNFRECAERIALHLAVHASQYIPTKECTIQTPIESTTEALVDGNVVLLPILRAGLSMVAPFQQIIPTAFNGYIGLKRNEETLQPHQYYWNTPTLQPNTTVFILDPMLATGGSICATIDAIRTLSDCRIVVCSLIAAPEGVQRVQQHAPNIPILVAALDRELNASGYIVPGLGDAGDRINGTL